MYRSSKQTKGLAFFLTVLLSICLFSQAIFASAFEQVIFEERMSRDAYISIYASPSSTVKTGETIYLFDEVSSPDDPWYEVSYKSFNESVALVCGSTITALSPGTAKIVFYYYDIGRNIDGKGVFYIKIVD